MILDEKTNDLLTSLPKRMDAPELFKMIGRKVNFSDSLKENPAKRKTLINSLKSDWFYAHYVHMEIYDNLYDAIHESYRLRHPDNTIKIVNATREWMENAAKKGYAPPALNDFVPSGFSILGISGAGKTHSVTRILRSCFDQLIHRGNTTQITYLKTNCTHRGSLKEMCLMFLHEVDNLIGSKYVDQYTRAGYNTEELCAVVGNVAARHHVAIWIIDEIHHLKSIQFRSKDQIINFLKNLNAVVGLPIVYIGTGEATSIIAGNFQQARRAQGLGSIVINEFKEGSNGWKKLMASLWQRQILRNPGPLTDEISEAYYRRSQGIFDTVMTLHIQVQKRALTLGKETIDVALIDDVAEDHLKMTKPAMMALARSRKDPKALRAFPDLSLRGLEFLDDLDKDEKPKLSISDMVKFFTDNGFNENEISMCIAALVNKYPSLSPLEVKEKAQEILDNGKDKTSPKKKKANGDLIDAIRGDGEESNYEKLKSKGFAKTVTGKKAA